MRSALVAMTKVNVDVDEGEKVRPLVVVIDELDRCRPDYAISLLEIVKHFFSVPNIHFILGVNLDALCHSVKVRYGESFDGRGYLRCP